MGITAQGQKPASPAPLVRASAEQALVRKDGRTFQLVRVEVSHVAPPASAVITAARGGRIETRLGMGYTVLYLPVDPVTSETETSIEVSIDGGPARRGVVLLKPVPRRELWLLPHSHTDIGYSDPQDVVEKNHWSYLERAIEIARRTAGYPPGAKFKWNTEVLWAVETYLRQASSEKRAAFFDAVRRGWIGLQGLLANELTGLGHPEELFHLLDFARRLATEEGLRIEAAMITDIPSYTWSVVPALAQSGVRYLSSGPNYMANLPDGGDRIGGALKAWGDKPFYWVGPSGQERILFWMAGRGYSWFHGLNMGSLSLEKAKPILDYCRELAEAEYPYDMVQVRYTIGGDNGPPDASLPDTVKAWNEAYESPRLVIATAQEMFEEFERRHGAKLPVVRGDFTPYWEDGATSTAREQAMNRASANRLLVAEALWVLVDPTRFPVTAFDEAWRQVILWDEHTWGAADSVSSPDGENARRQWEYKQAFALEAERRSRALLGGVLSAWSGGSLPSRTFGNAVDVINPTGWPRIEVVAVPKEWSAAGDLVSDEKGLAVPSQRLSSGELAVLAGPVPAFAAKRYVIRKGSSYVRNAVQASEPAVENNFIRAVVDETTGAVASLLWKSGGGLELVDKAAGRGLNEYLYVPGRDPRQVRGVTGVKISVGEPGPLVASLVVESRAPGARSLRREIRLTAASERLEFLDLIDKEKIRDKESVHIGFPFRVPEGEIRIDLGWGFLQPGVNQIAGSCKDFFGLQNAADISNRDYGVTWVSLDAPLAEVGEITDERPVEKGVRGWRTFLPQSRKIFAYVMNNYWHTNYKADQEGPVLVRFVVRPHPRINASDIVRMGIEAARPLVVVPAAASGVPWSGVGLEAEPSSVLVVSLKPSRDGRSVMARLYNPTDRPVDALLGGRFVQGAAVWRSSPFEDRREALSGPLLMMPYETVALRIDSR